MSALKATARRAPNRLAALTLAAATAAAGCGVTTPRATSTGPAAGAGTPTALPATPPVFASTLVPVGTCRPGHHPGADSCLPWPVGLFSSATGHLVRLLTRPVAGTSDLVLSVRGDRVYFTVWRASAPPGVWRVPLTGGPARLVRAGTADYALSPDGRMAAWVVTVKRGPTTETTEIVVTNLVTGQRHTIVMVKSQPVLGSQIGVSNLTWSPDDTHLAAEAQYAAFASDVIVFDARTARTIANGRKAPCPGGCAAKFPAYLRTGALTYLADQLAATGPNVITLVSWTGGHQAKRLVTVWKGLAAPPIVYGESTTPQGAAIWVLEKTQPEYAIWRWSGGKPVRLRTLPLPGYYGLSGVAW